MTRTLDAGAGLVLFFRDKYVTSWPTARTGWARTQTLTELCDQRWRSDVHFVAYLPGEPIGDPPAAATLGFDAAGNRIRNERVQQIDDDFGRSVRRRYDNEALGCFRFMMTLWVADVDEPAAHVTGKPARPAWIELMAHRLAHVAERHPKVFAFTTRGGIRIIFQRETPFAIETKADAIRYRTHEYQRFVRYLGRAFDIRVDPACANFSRLFRAPHVRRKVGDRWEDQHATFIGDPADLEVL